MRTSNKRSINWSALNAQVDLSIALGVTQVAFGDHVVSGSTGRSTLLSLLPGRSEALSTGQGQWILRSQDSPGRESTERRTVQTKDRASLLRRRLTFYPQTPVRHWPCGSQSQGGVCDF